MYIFKYFSRLDTVTIAKIINKKKINVLDYGCGVGTWTKKDLINKSFNKITLYDKNQKLYDYLKEKYKNRKVLINFNKNKVLENNKNYDLVVLSSVAQYLSKNELMKYDATILLTDHNFFDYKLIAKNSKFVFDTRGRYKKVNLDNYKNIIFC